MTSTDPELLAAFREREMRVERIVNWLRTGVGLTLIACDFPGLIAEQMLSRAVAIRVVALTAAFIAYAAIVERLSRPGLYRRWLKYLTIACDYALIGSIFFVYDDLGVRFGISREAFIALLAATTMLFVGLGALRRGVRVLAFSTSIATALFVFDAWRAQTALMLVLYGGLLIVLSGTIAWAVSSGITGMFVRLRRRDSLTRFLSKELVDQIDAGRIVLEPGGSTQTVTVLFSDIRGFTSMSETMKPEEIVRFLNEYLGRMTRIVFANRGTVDKFVGDAVMAVFGAPAAAPDDAARALRTAEEMLAALADLNARWRAEGRAEISIGIGLHTGSVVSGIIGSPERMEYTVIGDTVNVASRLEGLNKQYGTHLLMSEATCRDAGALGSALFVAEASVRGRQENVRLYTVRADSPART